MLNPSMACRNALLDNEQTPFSDINELATVYVNEIRKVQPEGPFYIGGHSLGGQIAYVMAQILLARGESVALLALLDSYSGHGRRFERLPKWWARHRQTMSEMPLIRRPGYVAGRLYYMAKYAKNFTLDALKPRKRQQWTQQESARQSELNTQQQANSEMARNFLAGPYAGPAVVFKAEGTKWRSDFIDDGWEEWIEGHLDIVSVPGDHTTLLDEPQVRALGREIGPRPRRSSVRLGLMVGRRNKKPEIRNWV